MPLDVFKDRWRVALAAGPPAWPQGKRPLRARTLAEAHRLAWEAIDELREVDPDGANRLHRATFGRKR